MEFYQTCDLVLASNVPFPELPRANGREPECAFELLPVGTSQPASGDWYHQWSFPDGSPWLCMAKQGSGFLLRFPDLADFLVSPDGSNIRCYALPGTPPETIRHLFLDQVIPLVLSQRGRVVLHASAVATPRGAIAFMGASGTGKSTLAAAFCRVGFPLLTDDCFLLKETGGRFFAVPSYPGLRLWAETLAEFSWEEPGLAPVAHYTEKKRLAQESGEIRFCRDAVPVRRIYLLDPQEEPAGPPGMRIVSPPQQESLIELVKYTYCLDIQNREGLREQFERLGRLAASSLLGRLTISRNFAHLPDVREAILQEIGCPGAGLPLRSRT